MMHTNGGDIWYIVDTHSGAEVPYRSQYKAREEFKKKEAGRYVMKHFSELTMTTAEIEVSG